jgi:hypothetical protein
MNFGVKKFIVKKPPPPKTLMVEHYNLVDLKEQGAVIYWGWFVGRGALKLIGATRPILRVLFGILMEYSIQ